jgi:branched-chain amino acid transport system substrate-binding protein
VASALAADPYEISVILPLTGKASFLGKGEQQAMQLLEKAVNEEGGIQGRPVRFTFQDDQSSPQVAVQLASQIVSMKPSVVLGSAIVAQCNAMAPLMGSGPFMYCLSPGIHPKPGEFVYTSSVSTHDSAEAFVRYFKMKGLTKLAIITSTDASGQDAEKGIMDALAKPENASVELLVNVHFNPSDVSVTAQIERIKAAKPQAVIAWSTGAAIGNVFKAISQAELDVPIATTYGNMTLEQMTQYASFLPKQLLFSSTQWMSDEKVKLDSGVELAHKRFHGSYKAAGLLPDVSSTLAWDPAMIVIDALRKLGPQASAQQVRDHISRLKGYAGVNGIYDFENVPQRGLNELTSVVTVWNAAKRSWDVVSKPSGIPLDR